VSLQVKWAAGDAMYAAAQWAPVSGRVATARTPELLAE